MSNNPRYKPLDGDARPSNRISAFFQQLTSRIFESLYITLKAKTNTLIFTSTLIFIQWIQLIGIFFTDSTYPNWKFNSIASSIKDVVDFLHILPAVKKLGYIWYLAINIVFLFIVILATALFMYAPSTSNDSMKKLILLVKLNKYVIYVMITILIIPFFQMFLSSVSCQNIGGAYYMRDYPDQQCFSGVNILNIVFSMIGILVYFIYLCINSLLFYETRMNTRVGLAGAPSLCQFYMMIFSIINSVLTVFIWVNNGTEIQVVFNLIYCLILLYSLFLNNPYFHHGVEKLTKIMLVLFCWTVLIYTVSMSLEGHYIKGSFLAWLINLPCVAIIVFYKKASRVELLVIPQNTIHDPSKLLYEMIYLIKLWLRYFDDKEAAMILDGYFEVHRNICRKYDCPLTIIPNDDPDYVEDFKQIHHKLMTEDLQRYIDMLYFDIIKRFETNIKIRINYLFFLMDKLKNKIVAVKELAVLEKLHPNIQEKFIIYRYKRLAEDIENDEDEHLLTVKVQTEVHNDAYDKYIVDIFMKKLEESVICYIDFWSIISHEKIDLDQLKKIGSKINKTKVAVEHYWGKIMNLNMRSKSEFMVVYGKYLTSIANDTEEGEELIAKAQTMIEVENAKKKDLNYFEVTDDISKILIPLVIVSGQPKQIGIIVNANLPLCGMFGYSKKDLIGKNINILVPEIIAKRHDSYIENVIEKKRVNFFNMGRVVYAKHQSEYLIPVSIRGKLFMGSKILFVATMRILYTKDTIGIIIVDDNGEILDISAGTYLLLGISIKSLNTSRDLNTYFPDMFKDIAKYANKMEVEIPNSLLSPEVLKSKNGRKFFMKVDQVKYIGLTKHLYIIKIFNEISNIDDKRVAYAEQKRSIKFQMNYSVKQNALMVKRGGTKTMNENLYKSGTYNDAYHDEDHANSQHSDKLNYGEGIKTMRLDEGKIVESKENLTEDDEDLVTNAQEKIEHIQNSENDDLLDELNYKKDPLLTSYNKSKHVKAYIKNMAMPSFVRIYVLLSHILILMMLGTVLADFFLKRSRVMFLNTYIDILDNTLEQETEVQNILGQLSMLAAANNSTVLEIDTDGPKDLIDFSVNKLENLNNQMVDLRQKMTKNEVYKLLFEETATVYIGADKSQTTEISLRESRKQILTKAFYLKQNAIGDINFGNPLLYFIFNAALNNVRVLAKKCRDSLINYVISKMSNRIIYIAIDISLLIVSVLSLIVIYQFYSQMNEYTKSILSIFTRLSDRKIGLCLLKCEDFLNYIQSDKEDNNMLTDADIKRLQKLGNQESTSANGKSRKKFDKSFRMNKAVFVIFTFIFLLTEAAYFLSVFVFHRGLENTFDLIREFNTTKSVQSEYNFYQNAIAFAAIQGSRSVTILNMSFDTYNNITAKTLYDLDSSLYEWKHHLTDRHSDSYNDLINSIVIENTCDLIKQGIKEESNSYGSPDLASCDLFLKNPSLFSYVANGLSVGLSFYQENIRYIANAVDNFSIGSADNDQTIYKLSCKIEAAKKNLCVFDTENFKLAQHFQTNYLQYFFSIWSESLREEIKVFNSKKLLKTQLLFMIGFLAGGLLLYVFFLFKFVFAVRLDVKKLENMLLMVPSDHSAHPSYLKGVLSGKDN